MRAKFAFLVSFLLLAGQLAAATVEPLEVAEELTVNIGDHKGKTFFELMTEEGGLRDKMNEAFLYEYHVPAKADVVGLKDKFSSKVWRNLYQRNQSSLSPVFDDEANGAFGKTKYSNRELNKMLQKDYKIRPAYVPGMFLSLSAGAALLVHLNENTYYYNAGYDDDGFANADEAKAWARENLEGEARNREPVGINSGRSYAAGPSHPADDASYVDYLKNVRAYYDGRQNLAPLFKAILGILTQNDPSLLNKLDKRTFTRQVANDEIQIDGQSLVGDFFAVYTAESYRFLFALMKSHDWMNALAELTFISAYAERAGLVQDTMGQIVKGTPSDWRYVGTQGSGIGGKAGINRRAFQRKVCNAARDLNIEALQKMDEMTQKVADRITKDRIRALKRLGKYDEKKFRPTTNADCFNSMMITLNDPRFQKTVKENLEVFTEDFVAFLGEIRDRHDEITALVKRRK